MISFSNDYSEGAHERVLETLARINRDQTDGYGEDSHCERAAGMIRALADAPGAAVHFLSGGTQANLTLIAAALRPHQGVVAADTGHINVHEAGAIEATGHKVLALPHREGKLGADDLRQLVREHRSDEAREHMVQPGMVYVSQSTELGTLYSRRELEALSAACRELELPLYLDGARLGCALACAENDLSLPDLARLCDAFTLGGTKQGALLGEAVVIPGAKLREDFRYLVKQRGGMLAKGWLLGVQFEALLEDGLYFDLAGHAVRQALRIRDALRELGVPFLCPSPTNQQFPILDEAVIAALGRDYRFHRIKAFGADRCAVRFCTSWATREEDVGRLIMRLRVLLGAER